MWNLDSAVDGREQLVGRSVETVAWRRVVTWKYGRMGELTSWSGPHTHTHTHTLLHSSML